MSQISDARKRMLATRRRQEAERKRRQREAQKPFEKITIPTHKTKQIKLKKPKVKVKGKIKKRKKSAVKTRTPKQRLRGKGIQRTGDVISPRGRRTHAEQAALEQPQSAQDYFLSSTAIASVAYDPKKQTLEITFVKGGTYQYFHVPEIVYRGFNSPLIPSKGRYFWAEVRGKYNFRRVR